MNAVDRAREYCFDHEDDAAAGVIDELVAAAQYLLDNWQENLSQPVQRLREAVEASQDEMDR